MGSTIASIQGRHLTCLSIGTGCIHWYISSRNPVPVLLSLAIRLKVARGSWVFYYLEVIEVTEENCQKDRNKSGIMGSDCLWNLVVKRPKWKSLSRVQLFGDPTDYTVHKILQARILEWVAYPFSSRSSRPRNQTESPHCRRILYQLSYQGCLQTMKKTLRSWWLFWRDFSTSMKICTFGWFAIKIQLFG